MNIIGPDLVEIAVTHMGAGLNGVIRKLNDAGYYALVVGNLGDVAVMYGSRLNFHDHRTPSIALLGDTIRVVDRS